MFKLIILVLGLGIGFSAGMWYGVHHPSEAASFSAAQTQELHDQMQAMKDKLKQLSSNQQQSSGGIAGTGIGANLIGGNSTPPAPDSGLQELDKKAQDQLDMLKKKLAQ